MVTKRLDWYKNKLSSVFGGVRIQEMGGYHVFIAEKRSRIIKKKKKLTKNQSKKLSKKCSGSRNVSKQISKVYLAWKFLNRLESHDIILKVR